MTGDVSSAPVELDLGALDDWLGDRLPGRGEPVRAERIGATTGIANALFLVQRGGHRWVVRRPPAVKNDKSAGDTVRVGVRVVEGDRTRVQAYEGVCIARSNRGLGSNFTVRKISFGEGVERVFPLYSPNIDSITVVRRGVVRRAKLYYLRGRTGKSARIAERKVVKTGQEG